MTDYEIVYLGPRAPDPWLIAGPPNPHMGIDSARRVVGRSDTVEGAVLIHAAFAALPAPLEPADRPF